MVKAMHASQLPDFAQSFVTPPPDAYPGAYWFWHHIPSPAQIEGQLKEMHHAGYRMFLIQPRLAFPMQDYLSQDYLAAYRYALRTAKALGMTAGLYDDYNWISGHAGGRTVLGHDHLRERHLFWCTADVRQGQADGRISGIHNNLADGLGEAFPHWIYEGGEARWADWQIVRVYARTGDELQDILAQAHITSSSPDGCEVSVSLPEPQREGTQVVFFLSARCTSSRLVNYLHPQTAARFIEAGYEPYRLALEDYFGDPLTFVFFDQPYAGFYTWNEHHGGPLNSLPYHESLEEVFQQARGYDLGLALLALAAPQLLADPAQLPRLRCDFYETYGELARLRFLAPLAIWAHEHGLGFSGHELLGFVGAWGFAEGLPSLDSRIPFGADYFGVDSYKSISTVDACNYHPQISARFGASAARANGRRGCLVEQYSVPQGRVLPAPAGQWDLSLDDLRAQALRHALAGAGKLIFHAYCQTNETDEQATPLSSPRFDFPPGINYMPWFRFHPGFAAELARLNVFLSQGQPATRIALLYPLRTFWHGGPGHAFNAESAFWNEWLSEQGLEFTILDERQMDAEALQQSGVRVLVLPGVEVVRDASFAAQLESFVQGGGWLVASGPLPAATQATGQDVSLQARLANLFSQHSRCTAYPDRRAALADPALAEHFSLPGGIRVAPEDVQPHPLWRWQGESAQGRFLVLFNDAQVERQLRLELDGNFLPLRFDPETGDCSPWGWYKPRAGRTEVHLPLPPRGLACLQFTPLQEDPCLPHLLSLQGEALLASAGILQERLVLSLQAYQPGTVTLVVAASQPPRVQAGPAAVKIEALSAKSWQVEIDIPHLPAALALDEGWRLRIPGEYKEMPVDPQRGWEQAYPLYAGPGYYRTHFALDEASLYFRWMLDCPGVETALVAYINQAWVGARGGSPYQLTLPQEALKLSYNHLEIAVWNTAGNAFYHNTPYQGAEPHPSGLTAAPRLLPFVEIILTACNHLTEGA